MKYLHSGWLWVFVLYSSGLFAQDFIGYVKKSDSLITPIFQANVQVFSEGQVTDTLKTYFNGSYSFTPEKNKTYGIKISYPGCVDTLFTVATDKNAKPTPSTLTVILKKDGMRLLGVIRSIQDTFPIKGATIVLKNVMTWKETRITTDIDGSYNFKLDYETNYRVSIDKYSPGIINKYKDTAFYISTVGFNLPLDYQLDIFLDLDHLQNTEVPDSLDNTRQPFKNKNAAVSLQLLQSVSTASASASAATKKEPKSKISESSTGSSHRKKKNKKQSDGLQVVVIGDSSSSGVKHDTGEKGLDETKVATLSHNDSLSSLSHYARQQSRMDSLSRIRILALARQKIINDSIAHAKAEEEKLRKISAAKKATVDSLASLATGKQKELNYSLINKQKGAADSINRTFAERQKLRREANAKKSGDTLSVESARVRKKEVSDSIAKEKADKQRIAKEEAAIKKEQQDSINHKKVIHQEIAQERKAEKVERDSLQHLKEQNGRKSTFAFKDTAIEFRNEPRKKGRANTLNNYNTLSDSAKAAIISKAHNKIIADSIEHAKKMEIEMAAKREYEDSLAFLAGFNRRKVVESQQQVKARQAAIEKEMIAKRMHDDSIARNINDAHLKAIADSVNRQNKNKATAQGTATKTPVEKPKEIRKPDKVATHPADTPSSDLPSVLFYKNAFDLTPKAQEKLKAVAKTLLANQASQIQIYALATTDEMGTTLLSKKRAEAAFKLLTDEGVPAAKIKMIPLGHSFSRARCNIKNCPDELMRQDRCVVYKITKD